MNRKQLLAFLQDHKFDLMQKIPAIVDIALDELQDQIIVRTAAPLSDPINITVGGELVPVEVRVEYPKAKTVEGGITAEYEAPAPNTVVAVGDFKSTTAPATDPAMTFENAIGPSPQGGRDSAAFEAWKKRHGK